MQKVNKPVAVILAGCGVNDGSEIQEAVFVLVSIRRNGLDYQCFAPDIPQYHVINHLTGEEMKETRNVLVESSRICRGDCKPLSELKSEDYSALIIPGGFGAAKNLCSYAIKGADMEVNETVANVIHDFHDNKKPIGLCCIAPIIISKVLPGVSITFGQNIESPKWPFSGTCLVASSFGANVINKNETEANVDKENKVVTSAAYMCSTTIDNIEDSVASMVKEVASLI
ncbi:hypothetical protein WA158_003236 [Blastocystis sp. Blastoise]